MHSVHVGEKPSPSPTFWAVAGPPPSNRFRAQLAVAPTEATRWAPSPAQTRAALPDCKGARGTTRHAISCGGRNFVVGAPLSLHRASVRGPFCAPQQRHPARHTSKGDSAHRGAPSTTSRFFFRFWMCFQRLCYYRSSYKNRLSAVVQKTDLFFALSNMRSPAEASGLRRRSHV